MLPPVVYVPLTSLFTLSIVIAPPSGPAATIELETPLRPYSAALLRIHIPQCSHNGKARLFLTIQGPSDSASRELHLFTPESPELPESAFTMTEAGDCFAAIPCFLSATKSIEDIEHPFSEPGKYRICLMQGTAGTDAAMPLAVTAIVVRGEPLPEDLKFFRLAKNQAATLLGIDAEHADVLGFRVGLALTARIVDSARNRSDPTHGDETWSDVLSQIADSAPGSSYAPYLWYYAACSYLWQKKEGFIAREYQIELSDQRVTSLAFYSAARRALELAVLHGDDFIKPLAVQFLAGLLAWEGDFEQARDLIARSKDMGVNEEQAEHVRQYIGQLELKDDARKTSRP